MAPKSLARDAVSAALAASFCVSCLSPALSFEGDLNVGTATIPDILAVIAKAAPYLLSDEWTQKLAQTVFCEQIGKAQNEFDRRDVVQKIFGDMRKSASTSSGVLSDISIRYELGDYDFARKGFPVTLSRYGHENARQLRRLDGYLWPDNSCWKSGGTTIGSVPNRVMFWPQEKQLLKFIPVSPEQARNFVQNGRPSYQLNFDLQVSGVALAPQLTPRFQLQGEMRNLKATVVDNNRNQLMALESPQASLLPTTVAKPQGLAASDECMDCDVAKPASKIEAEAFAKASIISFIEQNLFNPELTSGEQFGSMYAEQVSYFGKKYSRREVVHDKDAFIKRWTKRKYNLNESSLIIQKGKGIYKVSFDFNYNVSNAQGSKWGSGKATIHLSQKLGEKGHIIVLEDSKTD